MERCLYCYKPLKANELDFHASCAKKMFGTKTPPVLPYTRKEIAELARVVIEKRTTITGVQAKLSLDLENDENGEPQRLTIVGVLGRYILKPQTERFEALPEMEDLTMHLAEIAHIATVPHSLVRFADGELNYITRRIDRTEHGAKLPMEDMCQVSGLLTEQKYQGSYEYLATLVAKHSCVASLDVTNYWEQVIFSWIVGNADMHMKNFSLISYERGKYRLSPTYDQVSTAIVMPEDTEELALPLQGFKKKLMSFDFVYAMVDSGLDSKVAERMLARFQKYKASWFQCIDNSFITDCQKVAYKDLISLRLETLLK
ncbi:MAG: HipA domain-containing protein [Bacteroidaceae bacterium]|nr:HipA domain-containing protein [Bacteroidaceae bacterium]